MERRFDGLDLVTGEKVAITLQDGPARFVWTINAEVEASDHTIVLLWLHED